MTPRSLVGMTMGARKRAARLQYMLHTYEIGPIRREALSVFAPCDAASHTYKRAWRMYRIGQRLRPCPGCAKCHPAIRRFAPTAGWKSPRKWILWDGAKLWMIARTWRRMCTVPTLADYTSGVEDGTWRELFCDGSGVLPANGEARR